GMQMQVHKVFAHLSQRSLRQTHLALGYRYPASSHRRSDISRSHGTIQPAFCAGFTRYSHGECAKRRCLGPGLFQDLGLSAFKLGALRFKPGHILRRDRYRLAHRDQVISPVTGPDLYPVTQIAKLMDFLQQNYFHLLTSPSLVKDSMIDHEHLWPNAQDRGNR